MSTPAPLADGTRGAEPLAGCAVVMAHPDDEILWASSILRRAGLILLAFGPLAGQPGLGPGRARALAAFPLPTIVHLALQEAGALERADWAAPRPTAAGLQLRADPFGPHPRAARDYAANHARLVAELTTRLAGVAQVITHNPWGEYGHEEHVQLFRAVCDVQAVLGFEVWVSCYAAPRSMPLLLAERHRIGPATPALPTDPALAAEVMALYTAQDVWTWYPDYRWPDTERFFRLLPADTPPAPCDPLALNFLPIDWRRTPGLTHHARQLRRQLRLGQRLRRLAGGAARRLAPHPAP